MYPELETILIKLYQVFYDAETKQCMPFTEKDLLKRKIITKIDLEDFDELFDEGLIDVCDMAEVVDGSKELEYILAKEAIEYMNLKEK